MNHYVDRASVDFATVPLVLVLIDLTYRQERQRKLSGKTSLHTKSLFFTKDLIEVQCTNPTPRIRTHHGQTNSPIEVAVPEIHTKVTGFAPTNINSLMWSTIAIMSIHCKCSR
jgi:hypothetical protein